MKQKAFFKNPFALLLLVIVMPLLAYGVYEYIQNKNYVLPVLGPVELAANGDTLFHVIEDFEFVDQTGQTIDKQITLNKVVVIDFFFISCAGICPKMSRQMQRVHQQFLKDDNVVLLSHTVDPARDNQEAMSAYAELYGASGNWYFLTGDKPSLYKAARNSYMLVASEGDGGDNDFIHSEKFVLLDKQGRIRGYYDGTAETEVNQLMSDVRLLLK